MPSEKILCIVFKFLGDVVVSIPAIRALRQGNPRAEIHLLVAEDAAALVNTLPWIDKVWAFPRTRGKMRLRDSLPMIHQLRRERFDLSLDFVGNDRGAFLSVAAGAKRRVGVHAPRGFFGRRKFYHETIPEAPREWHECRRHLNFVRGFGAALDANLDLELRPNPALAAQAKALLPDAAIIAHISTSKPLKEWPLEYWRSLAQLAAAEGHHMLFAAGPSPRERALLASLMASDASLRELPMIKGLDLYLAVLAQAELLVSGDTGPMHFAAGVGIPTLSIFGPSIVEQWAPIAPLARVLKAPNCSCSPEQETCTSATPCLRGVTPHLVWKEIRELLALRKTLPVSAPTHE
ncbi:MAG TPA: glycosyltransferase family 9 protein [Opitutaceae bacterium]|nr:glycosyltransferase family 9 protein [Opitutaceae bacterium]